VWTDDFVTREGESFALSAFSLFPRTLQNPPPIYVGAVALPAIRRAAQLADGFVIGAPTARSEVRKRIDIYEQSVLALGLQSTDKAIVLNRLVRVVRDRAAKVRAEEFFAERFLHFYGRCDGHSAPRVSDEFRWPRPGHRGGPDASLCRSRHAAVSVGDAPVQEASR
jgi:alkanesulfonate monooxygenase SsuD/methylene tetrahydromethanopterin reductase-like flavin-dependent oxidoreductase (luciferase family)